MVFTIYSMDASRCKYCRYTFELLDAMGYAYTKYDVAEEQHKTFLRYQDLNTVPQIWIGIKHIGGYNDLCRFLGVEPRQ